MSNLIEPEIDGYYGQFKTLYDYNGKIVMIVHEDDIGGMVKLYKAWDELYDMYKRLIANGQ